MLKRLTLDLWFCNGSANYGLEIKKYCKIIPGTMEIILGLYIESPEVLPGEKNSMLYDVCFFDSMVLTTRETCLVNHDKDPSYVKNFLFPLYKRRLIKFLPVWYYPRKSLYSRSFVEVIGLTDNIRGRDLGIIEGDCFQYYNSGGKSTDDTKYRWKIDLLKRIAFGTRRPLKWNGRVVDI